MRFLTCASFVATPEQPQFQAGVDERATENAWASAPLKLREEQPVPKGAAPARRDLAPTVRQH